MWIPHDSVHGILIKNGWSRAETRSMSEERLKFNNWAADISPTPFKVTQLNIKHRVRATD